MYKKIAPIALSMLIYSSSFAATVAVIDSGVDIDHLDLQSKILPNSAEMNPGAERLKDDDHNGFIDDFYGWNFVAHNNQVYEKKYSKMYNSDIDKFFYLQYAMYLNDRGINIIDRELYDWYVNVLFDENREINEQLATVAEIFGGYAHGTHVAGIIARHHGNRIVPIKIIPSTEGAEDFLDRVTERRKIAQNVRDAKDYSSIENVSEGHQRLTTAEMESLKMELKQLALSQAAQDDGMFKYITTRGIRIANGSYGLGFPQALEMMKENLPRVQSKQLIELAKYFMDILNSESAARFKMIPNILFVAASGNDGVDNDVYPDYPSCVVNDNIISVGATWEGYEIADFSNYGKTTVDVFAPGVGIKSTAPGSNYVYMNGTSQAAPQVARIAGHVLDSNWNLSSQEIKKIIMGTVDKKNFLKDKCVSGGIVNEERAVYAAKLMVTEDLGLIDAIAVANDEINDVEYGTEVKSNGTFEVMSSNKAMQVTDRINHVSIKLSSRK